MSLSDLDREVLRKALVHGAGCKAARGYADRCYCGDETNAAVEQIIARHVTEARAAALNEAADLVDETARDWEPWTDGRNRTPEVVGAVAAFRERAMDIRNLANSPPP